MTRSILITLLVFTSVPYAFAEDFGADKLKIMNWGQAIQEALEKNSISTLEIDAKTRKNNPWRIINVLRPLTDQQEIYDVLYSAATALHAGDFEVIDQYNLATTIVSFRIQLPDVCIEKTGRFDITSTGRSMFYIGCIQLDDRADAQNQRLRIRSEKLFELLIPSFPKEILEQEEQDESLKSMTSNFGKSELKSTTNEVKPTIDQSKTGGEDSSLINDHYRSIRNQLPEEMRDELATFDELSSGPKELIGLLSQDESVQKAALNELWKNGGYEETYNRYGESVLPYIAYIVSDIENRNAKQALSFLFEVSRDLTVKSRRGQFAIVDEDALKEYADKLPQNLPELSSYSPLKPILIQTLSVSPYIGNRESAAWILVQAYDADQEIEKALGEQLRNKQTGNINMDVMAAIGAMTMSEAYKDGFLSPLTMGFMIDALDDSNVSNLSYATGLIIKYQPKAAIPSLISNLSSDNDERFSFSLRALGTYGRDAPEIIPQLEAILDSEENTSRREDIQEVVDQLYNIEAANRKFSTGRKKKQFLDEVFIELQNKDGLKSQYFQDSKTLYSDLAQLAMDSDERVSETTLNIISLMAFVHWASSMEMLSNASAVTQPASSSVQDISRSIEVKSALEQLIMGPDIDDEIRGRAIKAHSYLYSPQPDIIEEFEELIIEGGDRDGHTIAAIFMAFTNYKTLNTTWGHRTTNVCGL